MTVDDTAYNVLLADDHAIFRNGFLMVLQKHINIRQAYHASDGFDALKILHHKPVDLVFLDYYMPFIDGEKCMKIIRTEFPHVKVVVISMMNSAADILKMKTAGAHGIIVKNFNGDELGIAVKTVMAGRSYYDSFVSTMLLEDRTTALLAEEYQNQNLTSREKQILQLITEGKISKEIAEKLKTSQDTVEKQRKRILKKINGRGIADAIRYSLKNGIVSVNEFLHGEDFWKNKKDQFFNRKKKKE